MTEVKTYWKGSPILLLCFFTIFLAITYASFDSLVRMEYLWSTYEEYGYAYIIPFITAYFIWQKNVELKQVVFKINWLGGLFFIARLLFDCAWRVKRNAFHHTIRLCFFYSKYCIVFYGLVCVQSHPWTAIAFISGCPNASFPI